MNLWTSVKDRLPPYGIPVLVVYHGVVQHTAYARDVGEWRAAGFEDSDSMPESFVSHWMPLPDPPAPVPPKFDLRTRVLHIVQDIGRPSNLGSVGCEQYADMIMDLLESAL
jgi:Protein of unknown function (DUF551)